MHMSQLIGHTASVYATLRGLFNKLRDELPPFSPGSKTFDEVNIMSNSFSHVLSPIRVAGHLLKNRIISGPSTIHTASNGEDHPTEAASASS